MIPEDLIGRLEVELVNHLVTKSMISTCKSLQYQVRQGSHLTDIQAKQISTTIWRQSTTLNTIRLPERDKIRQACTIEMVISQISKESRQLIQEK